MPEAIKLKTKGRQKEGLGPEKGKVGSETRRGPEAGVPSILAEGQFRACFKASSSARHKQGRAVPMNASGKHLEVLHAINCKDIA